MVDLNRIGTYDVWYLPSFFGCVCCVVISPVDLREESQGSLQDQRLSVLLQLFFCFFIGRSHQVDGLVVLLQLHEEIFARERAPAVGVL